MTISREVRLKSRPVGLPSPETFELASVDVPEPGPGEAQVRNIWMSVDPYMRGRMMEAKSYVAPYQVGKVMDGGAIGEVVSSRDRALSPGDLVLSGFGWRERFNAPVGMLTKLDTRDVPAQAYLGVAGMTGLTAYVGLLKIAALKDGDVVFVSAASGAVGSIACQIAKLKGHTVIGSAGGPEKCAFLREIGVDHVIDYKAEENLTKALMRTAPDGIDVYFDNVGGAHLDAALASSRTFARFAECGMISQYNNTSPGEGLKNIGVVVPRKLRIEGFIVSDHLDQQPAFQKDMTQWIAEAKIHWRETVDEGIENAAGAFLKLFSGDNFGKMLVKLA